MMGPDRIPCCIAGCRRSARSVDWPGAVEWMCAKHYGVVSDWKTERADARRKMRNCRSRADRAQDLVEVGYKNPRWRREAFLFGRLFTRYQRRSDALWSLIKSRAQALQDSGYFSRKRRSRAYFKMPPIPAEARAFEGAFDQLARLMSRR